MASTFELVPLKPFGAEVLTKPADLVGNHAPGELKRLLAEKGLLLFRGQSLSFEEQGKLVELFGPVLKGEPEINEIYVTNVGSDADTQELLWHYDLSYCPIPFSGISLHAVDVVDGTTSTKFASTVNAAQNLPQSLKSSIGGLSARHIRQGEGVPRSVPGREITFDPDNPFAIRPVLMKHPVTGQEWISVSHLATDVIEGLEVQRSKDLLEALFQALYAPRNTYEHFWNKGDLVVWDNLAVQHARSDLKSAGPRVLQKVIQSTSSRRIQFAEHHAARARERTTAAANEVRSGSVKT